MKTQKNPEELYQYLRNQKGFEIARKSLLRQMEWFKPTDLENAIANTYGMLMVANGGNKDESIKFICKVYQPDNLLKFFEIVENKETISKEFIEQIIN